MWAFFSHVCNFIFRRIRTGVFFLLSEFKTFLHWLLNFSYRSHNLPITLCLLRTLTSVMLVFGSCLWLLSNTMRRFVVSFIQTCLELMKTKYRNGKMQIRLWRIWNVWMKLIRPKWRAVDNVFSACFRLFLWFIQVSVFKSSAVYLASSQILWHCFGTYRMAKKC